MRLFVAAGKEKSTQERINEHNMTSIWMTQLANVYFVHEPALSVDTPTTKSSCLFLCVRHTWCLSVNFNTVSGSCELMNAVHQNNEELYKNSTSSFIHFTSKVN